MILEQFEATENKCPKWSTISRWKAKIASSFFQVIQWFASRWIIGQCCFHHLTLKEWMTYYQFRGEKRVQRPSLRFLVLRLSSFTIAAWVDLTDQRTATYRVHRKSSVGFSLRIFLDLMDIACVNSYLIYNLKHPNKLYLLHYNIVVVKNLIQYHQGRKRAVSMSRPFKRKCQPESIDNHGEHLHSADYQTMRKRCTYCAMEGKENRKFVICLACKIPLCLVKEKKLFPKASHLGVQVIYTLYIFAKTLRFFVGLM